MRIIIAGPPHSFKQELCKAIATKWPMYKIVDSYTSKFTDDTDVYSEKTQRELLEYSVNTLANTTKDDNIIQLGSPMDVLLYCMLINQQDPKAISDEFIHSIIPIVRESQRNVDIVFFTPKTKFDTPQTLTPDEESVRTSINQLWLVMEDRYAKVDPIYYPVNDVPAHISLSGSTEERMYQVSLYITESGGVQTENFNWGVDEDTPVIGIDPDNNTPETIDL